MQKLNYKGMKYFTSDFHFGHYNVISYTNRPFSSVEEMNEKLIHLWNNTITKSNDEVYFLGDFSLNKKWNNMILPQLNGIKHLIPGNHDEVFPFKHYSQTKQDNLNKFYFDAGWSTINRLLNIKLDKYDILLSHLPYLPHNIDQLNFDLRYKEYRPIDKGNILLHGHLHNGKYIKHGRMIDVGIDGFNCTKIWTEDEIIAMIEDKRDFIPSWQTRIIKIEE